MISDSERSRRIAVKQHEEREEGQEHYYWLSFCDPLKPKTKQFLGVCIVRAFGVATAILRAHQLGINPGGEVASWEIPEEAAFKVQDHADKLITSKKDLKALGL